MQSVKHMLLVGGGSDIGRAIALHYAQRGWQVLMAARDVEAAKRNAKDIAVRTATEVPVFPLDILEPDGFSEFLDRLPALPDTIVCVVGMLGEQRKAEVDLDHARTIMRTNFEGPALLLGLVAERFAARGSGTIIGLSSVAGDRGRGSNYVYGASKAGFTAFLSGLRNRLALSKVHVVTVKPGFVRTKMTAHMTLPGILTADPDEVARRVYDAGTRNDRDIVYVRPIWRHIMAAIRIIPEGIFKRLKL